MPPALVRLVPLLLQCLPLLGLGGCTALWNLTPVGQVIRAGSAVQFWSFMGMAGLFALAALSWGLGYFYLARRERLGCGIAILGPLLVLWSYGYAFEGFGAASGEADEVRRGQAMLNTLLLCSVPAVLMTLDIWRLMRKSQSLPPRQM